MVPVSLQRYRRHTDNTTTPVLSSPAGFQWRAATQAARNPTQRESYRSRAAVLQSALARQSGESSGDAVPAIGRRTSYDAASEIEREITALHRRDRLVNGSWFRRRWYPFELLVRGDYAFFVGWRSFLRDLAR